VVGTALTTALAEGLRIAFGLKFLGMADTIYGFLLVVFIIFLPRGIYGSIREALRRHASPPASASAVPAKTIA
jgi:branched-chain amino acid transport system permease protein